MWSLNQDNGKSVRCYQVGMNRPAETHQRLNQSSCAKLITYACARIVRLKEENKLDRKRMNNDL